jgi:inorganic pyrophosphatase/exopolyphosphatase
MFSHHIGETEWKKLMQEKFNPDCLKMGFEAMLYRDYKTYDFGEKLGNMGAAVVTVPIIDVLKHFNYTEVCKAIEKQMVKHNTDLFAIFGTSAGQETSKKGILLFRSPNSKKPKSNIWHYYP